MMKKHLIGLLGLCLLAGQAAAGLLDQDQESPFLPVDEAFMLEAGGVENGQLLVRWQIAEDYYLYHHRLGFRLTDPPDLKLGEVVLPDGKPKHDEYFGDVEVYYDQLVARLSLQDSASLPDSISLDVDYQGCAERGLCYPPQTRNITFNLADTAAGAASDSGGTGGTGGVSESDRLAKVIGSGSWIAFSLQFFGLGLLLAFTPCILPMIPILSSVIVGLDSESSTLKGFLLSLSYVLAMAAAYAFLGAMAGLFGQNLQAALQAPLFIGLFSSIFVLLALAMFGVFRLQLPADWQGRLHEWSNRHQGGTFVGAAAMGFAAALIVGPCLAPPLAGALLYIGQAGDPARGAAALFSLGLGIGTPLVVLGTLEGRLLPKAGPWMERVNHIFGVILLGVAVWLLGRVIPDQWTMLLWAVLVIGSGLHLGALERHGNAAWARTGQALGLAAVLYGAVILVGGMMGGNDPLRPLPKTTVQEADAASSSPVNFQPVKTRQDLEAALQRASTAGRPVILDFYADWCVSCKHMKESVFPDNSVRQRMDQFVLLQADVTINDSDDRALMKDLEVMGPPTLLFYDKNGEEKREFRLVGELNARDFAAHLDRILSAQ